MLKKGLIVGILCLLMLVYFPLVTGDFVVYPKEEGPYTVFIGGKPGGGGASEPIFFNATIGFQFGPFCKYHYP